MDEKILVALTDEINRTGKKYFQAVEFQSAAAKKSAKNELLILFGNVQRDYANVKLSYFKKEITKEQFNEISLDLARGINEIAMSHGGADRDMRHEVSEWIQRVKKDNQIESLIGQEKE